MAGLDWPDGGLAPEISRAWALFSRLKKGALRHFFGT
jgi:hypothetical protein